MRCNRSKPILGKFQILCGVLIVSVILGINALSSVEAVTEIGPGDRILFLGDQWARNGTAAQTGFEVIRLSSYVDKTDMKKITETLNLKLMIGLALNVQTLIYHSILSATSIATALSSAHISGSVW